MSMDKSDPGIPLADLVDAIRAELETAAINARGKQLQFEVQDIQLEVEVATTGAREAEGGLKVWVLTIGAKGSKTNADTHRVTLNMGAMASDGSKFRVSDVSPKPIRRD
jgi:hypothetical protein